MKAESLVENWKDEDNYSAPSTDTLVKIKELLVNEDKVTVVKALLSDVESLLGIEKARVTNTDMVSSNVNNSPKTLADMVVGYYEDKYVDPTIDDFMDKFGTVIIRRHDINLSSYASIITNSKSKKERLRPDSLKGYVYNTSNLVDEFNNLIATQGLEGTAIVIDLLKFIVHNGYWK